MSLSPEELVRRAELAERSGLHSDAKAAWDALISAAPTHPKALFAQGRSLVSRGQARAAVPLLAQAEDGDPGFAEAPFFLALAHKMLGDLQAAVNALDRALAIDPYFFMALLSKAALLEQLGFARVAARTYRNALKIAPSDAALPPSQRAAVDHARKVCSDHAQELAAFLRVRTQELRGQHANSRLERFDECLDILAGVKKPPVQDPLLLLFPHLPLITFFDREAFPWLKTLEAATPEIQAELDVVLREDRAAFAPYIQLPPEAPVNQWEQLNHSPLWTTYNLWRDGVRDDANCARCPKTTALLEGLPLARQEGFGPTVVFSVLQPHTRIPPHTGSTNVRLLTHLPLILPPGCGFRVGNQVREWRIGEAWVFDDSVDHEAWNDSDETRVILIFDVWNPYLTEAERELVSEMMRALNEFNDG
ncbi:MAG: aspartyl/asparaginyl beta-hydroxylase domain-containing protein [Hyphomonadaceae bacterium]